MPHAINARVGNDKFPIIIGKDLIDELNSFISSYRRDSVLILCDNFFQKSKDLYSLRVNNFLKEHNHHYIDGGIEEKSLDSFSAIIKLLCAYQIPKDGLIVGVGGGVIGDLSAFVASTYKRGVDLVHFPTTTTAMIDSCVGGKTGLNFLEQVNLIGSYYNPKAIFIDINFLSTLRERDYYSGLCEAIKMSLTSDRKMANRLLEVSDLIELREYESLEEIIYWSIITKLRHVADDAQEKSIRLILNYGHTFGQSVESFYGINQDELRHGEAVALGIKVAAKLSLILNQNDSSEKLYKLTNDLLYKYKLPKKFSDLNTIKVPTINQLMKSLINDKKRISKGNRFILCDQVGSGTIKIIEDKNIISKAYMDIF
tara:strand:+ start:2604 stop:3713 length:1110 start_codon:yes stop_codon:yes gene_type:complete